MKVIVLGLAAVSFTIILSLALVKTPSVIKKAENSVVKFNLKDLPEHGISMVAPSDPAFTQGKAITIHPYSVILKNTSNRSVVGYSLKWQCSDGQTQTAATSNLSNDRLVSHVVGFAFMYGEESERNAILNTVEDVIKPDTTWLISVDYARPMNEGVAAFNADLDKAAVAQVIAACPTMTVIADGIFFDDGTFIGPDTSHFFSQVKAQVDTRYEILREVEKDLKSGKSSSEIFRELEQIRDHEKAPDGGEMTLDELHSYFRKVFAQDVLAKKNVGGPDKAIQDIQQLLSKPWVNLRKL